MPRVTDLPKGLAIFLAGSAVALALWMGFLFHAVYPLDVVFTHYYYLPIILVSFWWWRAGVPLAAGFFVYLVVMHAVFVKNISVTHEVGRGIFFLLVAGVVSGLAKRSERIQRALLRQERLATIGAVAASISHDLRNTFGVMTNAVYLLGELGAEKVEDRRRYLGVLQSQIAKSTSIVNDLLLAAKMVESKPSPGDLTVFLDRLLTDLNLPPRIRLVKFLDEPLPMLADWPQMERLFENLLANAIQSMPERGTLTVSARRRDGWVEAEVTDTGCGVPEEDLDLIFEPLFTTKPEGTGLGLPIVKRIVDIHGGTVAVRSAVRKGSTFTVRFPGGLQRPVAPSTAGILAPQGGREEP